MNARLVVSLALAATSLVPATGTAAACATTKSGPWTGINVPSTVDYAHIAVAFGTGGHDALFGYGYPQLASQQGRTVWRTTDLGCTWTSVLSLDATGGTATDWDRLDPNYTIASVAVAQATAKRPAVVYAVAVDFGTATALSLPIVTFASTDLGAHWTVHRAAQGDLSKQPRCSYPAPQTQLDPTGDQDTVYLRCGTGLAEYYQTCPLYFVSHDRTATWIRLPERAADPMRSGGDQLGCPHRVIDPRPSFVVKGEVWDGANASNGDSLVVRSTNDGRAYTEVARAPVRSGGTWYGVYERPGRATAYLLLDDRYVYAGTAGSPLVKLVPQKPPAGTLDTLTGATLVAGPGGSVEVLVAYTTKQPISAVAFGYDLARRKWRTLPSPPRSAQLQPAWYGTNTLSPRTAPDGRATYFVNFWSTVGYSLIRYTAR